MEEEGEKEKKPMDKDERTKLAAILDNELIEFIDGLEKKSYTEGWPEDRWQEEMEKHPFFMQKMPEPGEIISPLLEGLQQLKYGTDDNTPEELANNYKEDGNFNFKYKKYCLAILSYTEGLRTKCQNQELMAQLYNNRAAAQFMLSNYRSCLADCKSALSLKPNYVKAMRRAALSCLQIHDHDQCNDFYDRILEKDPTNVEIIILKKSLIAEKNALLRDQRKQDKLEKEKNEKDKKLFEVIKSKGITLELVSGRKYPKLEDLEPQVPQIAKYKVRLVEDNKLVWPAIFLYPEVQETDFVESFHEDVTLIEQLMEIFKIPSDWDAECRYMADTVNVYFEGENKKSLHKADVRQTLGEILSDTRFVVRGGTPAFLLFVKSSKAESRYLATY